MPRLLLGSYTDTAHLVEFRLPTPDAGPKVTTIAQLPIPNASWLVQHPTLLDLWYIAIEVDDNGGKTLGVEGRIALYRISRDGKAELLDEISARANPCHVEIIAGGKAIAVANFSAGTALLVPLRPDGTFQADKQDYWALPKLDASTPLCHQAVYVPEVDQVWVVDTGNSVLWRMGLKYENSAVQWELADKIVLPKGHGPRQIVVSANAQHLYTLYARSCLVTHHDLSRQEGQTLVSSASILPSGHEIDLANRIGPPFTTGAALTLHAPSSTLSATSRLITGETVDSVAMFKISPDGSLSAPEILRPSAGREYRGVGVVGECFLVFGQTDGWMSCFEWNAHAGQWTERKLEEPVRLDKVVDIKEMK